MKEITHIERSNLPWRSERATECGLDADQHPTWTRDEAIAKARQLGRQRFSLFVCMTCMSTAERHATWETDPASCMDRYASRLSLRWHPDKAEHRRFADELRAIALLIEAHREEFDATVADLGATQDIAALRKARPRPKGIQP